MKGEKGSTHVAKKSNSGHETKEDHQTVGDGTTIRGTTKECQKMHSDARTKQIKKKRKRWGKPIGRKATARLGSRALRGDGAVMPSLKGLTWLAG